MNRLDVYYRALRQYRKEIGAKRQCNADNHAVAIADTKLDKIVFERKSCEIDRTWVDEIEKGLVFVEKAIKEERQFIRSNGEVVPIEKAKHVSKASVEHLAKHSNLITHLPEDPESDDIIPDSIYTVEKLSDYAVYENRFLYMLLCYVRDFITLRYNNILDISNTYNASMSMEKSVKTEKQTLIYKVELSDKRKDDEYLTATNSAQEIIDRIDLLLKTVLAFLATPLMEMVAKSPMLKPPITKTNVLKMNNNFKGAMALYGFVTSYEGDGYTIHTETKKISPFEPEFADEIANSVTIAAFLTYKRALDIEHVLSESFDEEERRRKEEEFHKRLEKIENLQRRLKNREITPEEYIIDVEKALREYEKKLRDYNKTVAKLEATETELASSLERENQLKEENKQHIKDIETQKFNYENQLEEQRNLHESQIEEINNQHQEEMFRINLEHSATIETIHTEYREQFDALKADCNTKIEEEVAKKNSELAAIKEQHNTETSALKKRIQELAERANAEIQKNKQLSEEQLVMKGKLLALKSGANKLGPQDSFVTEESFNELEKIYESFKRYYNAEWTKAKRQIRKEYLWGRKPSAPKAQPKEQSASVARPKPQSELPSDKPKTQITKQAQQQSGEANAPKDQSNSEK